jgi:hypothetical protein
MRLSEIWGGIGGRRARELEGEVARLRAENRALMNSILGIAGVPPVIVGDVAEAEALRLKVGERMGVAVGDAQGVTGGAVGRIFDAKVSARGGGGGKKNSVAPMRRRSWHQVYRMLEIDAIRKKERVGSGDGIVVAG